MDTILLVQISGNTWEQLDLFEEIPITLTIQQSDLTDLTSRRVPYSRTIQIPDTNRNAITLEHYFEVNGIEFNPLQKVTCVVQYRGTDIFSGVLRLNSVIERGTSRIYEIFILGEISDWTSYFRDLNLQELNYTDLNHDHVYSALTKSWECVNDGVSGLFDGKIIYPMINYGLDYQGNSSTGATPTFEYSFGQPFSFDQSGYPIPVGAFKPAIQIKTVLDRIFSVTPFTVVSDFFDSEYFTSIYMDTFQNGRFGIDYASGVTNQNIFKAGGRQRTYDYEKNTYRDLNLFDTLGGYDPLGNYTNRIPYSYFTVPYAGQYGWNLRFNVKADDLCFAGTLFPPEIQVASYISDDPNQPFKNSPFYISPAITVNNVFSPDINVNLFFSASCQAGDIVTVRLAEVGSFYNPACFSSPGNPYTIKPYNDGVVQDEYIFWELYESPQIITELVDMKLGIPNINAFEFFKGLVTMFNLIITQEKDTGNIRIEPYNWYYNDPDRPVRDFTPILDLNSEVKKEPLSFDLSKELVWTYKYQEFELLNREFFTRNNFVFGYEKFTSTSNILTGIQEYKLPFCSLPTSGVTGAPNFIIPQVYQQTNQQQQPYSTIPHLFFWVGNRLCYLDNLKSVQGSYYISSGGTPVEWTTYPCVSHLSTLESQFSPIISDLNFDYSFDFFGNTVNLIQQFTQNNLYNLFWRTYVDNIYSPDTKRLSGSFWFRPIDVYETELNDKIWVKDAWYTIEKLTDANLVNKQLTPISLIKERDPYYKVIPPPPIYTNQPNDPYPTPSPWYYSLCYVSTDLTEVCNGTTPTLTTVYTFGPPTIQNLDKVYYDTGSSFLLFPMGTYIRQTTSSQTFVVADTFGRVLEINC